MTSFLQGPLAEVEIQVPRAFLAGVAQDITVYALQLDVEESEVLDAKLRTLLTGDESATHVPVLFELLEWTEEVLMTTATAFTSLFGLTRHAKTMAHRVLALQHLLATAQADS